MKKPGKKTYMNEDKDSLVIASANIKSGHGLPLGCHGVAQKIQNISKAVKSRCGDNKILENYP